MTSLPHLNRRAGMVLLMVIVVIAIAALSGTTAMYLAGGELASAGTALKREQSRALAWSGVQAAMAELADQRDKLLDGQSPTLTREWELYTEDSVTRGVVRLVSLGSGPAENTDVSSESAKLDLNSATADMLAKIPGLDTTLAAAIIAARGGGRFSSVADLLRVKGITPEMLRGSEADGEPGDSTGPAQTNGLADLLTVFSFDPNVQSGLGQNGSDHRGKLRLNLSAGWSDALGQAIDDRFGAGSGAAVKAVIGNGQKFAKLSDVIAAARTQGLQPKDWPAVLDVFSVTDDPFLLGRVDLNRAATPVLSAIPGISAEAAQQIIDARAKLDDDSKRTPAWPAVQGILTPDQFQQAVDYLTTRSMQWRVRIEAGSLSGNQTGGADRASDAPLANRVSFDVVIDVSSERTRIAYLREVTLLDTAVALAAESAASETSPAESAPTLAADHADGSPAPSGTTGATGTTSATAGDLDLSTSMDKGFDDLDLGGDLNLGGGLKLGSAPVSDPIQGASAPSSAAAPPTPPVPPDSPPAATGGQDRRLGRWTTGKSTGAGS